MKKIIAIVVVIATITAILCIGANAYEMGDLIKAGSTITMKENITLTGNNTSVFRVFNGIISNENNYAYAGKESDTLKYYIQGVQSISVYNYNSNTWTNEAYKTVVTTQDITIQSTSQKQFFNEAVQSVVEPYNPPYKINILNQYTSTTFTIATAIIAWLMANQIALVGLYLYIIFALLATGKRFIKGV